MLNSLDVPLHGVQKRPFDRLEGSSFGIAKRTPRQLTIADALDRLNEYYGIEQSH